MSTEVSFIPLLFCSMHRSERYSSSLHLEAGPLRGFCFLLLPFFFFPPPQKGSTPMYPLKWEAGFAEHISWSPKSRHPAACVWRLSCKPGTGCLGAIQKLAARSSFAWQIYCWLQYLSAPRPQSSLCFTNFSPPWMQTTIHKGVTLTAGQLSTTELTSQCTHSGNVIRNFWGCFHLFCVGVLLVFHF